MPADSPDAAALAASLRAVAEAVAGLPRTIETELLAARATVPLEIVHGPENQWAAWSRHAAETRPMNPVTCYPDLSVVRAQIAATVVEATATFREDPDGRVSFRPRAIVAADAVVDAEDRRVLDELERAGAEVRLHPAVPSWLYADPGVLSAVPLVWGEHPPESIAIVRDPAISTALAALLEPMWQSATPYAAPTPDWAGTLQLAALGLGDRAVAAAQGVSPRTVQRRFTEAMDHYGVTSRFALGAAWRQDAPSQSTALGDTQA